MRLARVKPGAHPAEDADAMLVQRVKAAVLAALGGRRVDSELLDAVVRRVVAEMGR